jgi:formylglycine-generating enzyme required for sulfatase activity
MVAVGPFFIGRFPVTNEEYGRYLVANPDVAKPAEWGDRAFNGARQPVVGVTWHEARRFAAWAGCRLPSEAEWEYAARAGTTAPYLSGKHKADLDRFAWSHENAGDATHAVGGKEQNAFGLHDVLGNAWEWIEDDWHDAYEGAPTDGSAWVEVPRSARRLDRGGSWYSWAKNCRVAMRLNRPLDERDRTIGFRVARS